MWSLPEGPLSRQKGGPGNGVMISGRCVEEGWMGPGRKVLNERQVSHDPYKRRRGDEAASGSPKAALSEPAGQKKQPVSLAAVPPSGAQEGS